MSFWNDHKQVSVSDTFDLLHLLRSHVLNEHIQYCVHLGSKDETSEESARSVE